MNRIHLFPVLFITFSLGCAVNPDYLPQRTVTVTNETSHSIDIYVIEGMLPIIDQQLTPFHSTSFSFVNNTDGEMYYTQSGTLTRHVVQVTEGRTYKLKKEGNMLQCVSF